MEGGGDRRVLHGPDLCDPCDRRSPDALAYGVASLAGALGFFSIAGFLYFYSSRMAALRGAAAFRSVKAWPSSCGCRCSPGFSADWACSCFTNGSTRNFSGNRWTWRSRPTWKTDGTRRRSSRPGTIAARMMGNPLFVVFSGVGTMIIYGGLLGLIVSLFVKRHGDPFAGANNGQNGTMPPQSE